MLESGSSASVEVLPFVVSIVDEPASSLGGEKGIFGRSEEPSVRQIPVEVLRESLRAAVAGLRSLFDQIAVAEGQLRLKEAQIAFEVTASGGIALLGTSAQMAGKGGITLTFGE